MFFWVVKNIHHNALILRFYLSETKIQFSTDRPPEDAIFRNPPPCCPSAGSVGRKTAGGGVGKAIFNHLHPCKLTKITIFNHLYPYKQTKIAIFNHLYP